MTLNIHAERHVGKSDAALLMVAVLQVLSVLVVVRNFRLAVLTQALMKS